MSYCRAEQTSQSGDNISAIMAGYRQQCRDANWRIARSDASKPRDSRRQAAIGDLYNDPLIFAAYNQVLPGERVTGELIVVDLSSGRGRSGAVTPRSWLEASGMCFADSPYAPLSPAQEAYVAGKLIRHYAARLRELTGYHDKPRRDHARHMLRVEIVRYSNAHTAMREQGRAA